MNEDKMYKFSLICFFITWIVFGFIVKFNNNKNEKILSDKDLTIIEMKKHISENSEVADTLHLRYFNDLNESIFYADMINHFSKMFGLNKWYIVATIFIESNFYACAVNREKTCYGLMQLNLNTAEEMSKELGIPYFGKSTLYDPYYNLLIGCYYLTIMEKLCRITPVYNNHLKNITICYNVGMRNYFNIKNNKYKLPKNYKHWNRINKEYCELIGKKYEEE